MSRGLRGRGLSSVLLLDITRLLDRALRGVRPTGVDRVGLAYVAHFGGRAQALVRFGGRWVVFGRQDSQRLFAWVLEPIRQMAGWVRFWVGRGYGCNWRGAPAGTVLLHSSHDGLQHAAFADEVRARGWRAVYFVHDLIPLEFPEYGRAGEAARHRARMRTVLSSGVAVVVNSAATGRALEGFALREGRMMVPWTVAHLAPVVFPNGGTGGLAEPYFVMLGTIEARKNHWMVLNVWRQLVAELRAERVPKLVLIGRRGWECEQVVDMLERCEVLRGVVLEQGDCDDAMVGAWLRGARALLFPSFAEGFGIPLVEALAVGTPVIASDLEVFREVAGEVPVYLSPLDGLGWKAMVREFARPDSAVRAAQLRRLAGWEAPTWAGHCAQVERFLQEVVG